MSRLKDTYQKNAVPALMQEFKYKSVMQVPKLEKIVINTGVGETTQNIKAMQYVEYALSRISGQKPLTTKSRKSIASFKL